jgi:hypothetical protein
VHEVVNNRRGSEGWIVKINLQCSIEVGTPTCTPLKFPYHTLRNFEIFVLRVFKFQATVCKGARRVGYLAESWELIQWSFLDVLSYFHFLLKN